MLRSRVKAKRIKVKALGQGQGSMMRVRDEVKD